MHFQIKNICAGRPVIIIQIDCGFTLTAQVAGKEQPIRMAKVGLCIAIFSEKKNEYALLRRPPCIYEQMT